MAERKRSCSTCGFLARHQAEIGGPVPGFYEVTWGQRLNPNLAASIRIVPAHVRDFDANLVCFRDVPPPTFPYQATRHVLLRDQPDKAKAALGAQSECLEWCEYDQGHDPKEHLMERRLRHLEDDRKSFQATLARSGRGFVYLGLILAVAQVLTMTSESMLYRVGWWLFRLAASLAGYKFSEGNSLGL